MIDSRVLQLLLARGVGEVTIRKVFCFLENTGCDLDSLFCSKSAFLRTGIKPTLVDNIFLDTTIEKAKQLAKELDSRCVKMITPMDTMYPKQLIQNMGDSYPPILFAVGNVELLKTPSVGFCGSRKVSIKGIGITENCAKQLTEQKITVVSGYAAGTDLAAHSAALKNGGGTVFVLAEGILRFNIKNEVRKLLDEKNHVFISQFIPTASWNVGNAMKRNGVIIGLSSAMILVESGKTGGTFAAGEESLRRGCPLFVIDFEKPDVSAEANPYFIQAGGMPIRGKAGIPCLNKVFYVVQHRHNEASVNKEPSASYEQMRINI